MMQRRGPRIGVTLFLLAIFVMLALASGDSSSTPASKTLDLNVKVTMTGGTVSITNNDTFDWTNVKFEMNSQGLKSGYVYRTSRVKAGQTVQVSMSNFTLGDGTRFNILTTKALNFSVWCDVGNDHGFWYGE